MGRLPFDPDRMRRPRTPREPDAPISISALADLIERAVAGAFPERLTVRGEVSGTRERTHWYFNLKDEHAVIGAVCFASSARKSEVQPRDGRVVIASGRLEYYKPQGRLTFVVDRLREDGAGSLDAKFRALCEELRALGWFDLARKRALPVFPERIAVLTSASSAALQDVLDTTRRRCPAVGLLLVDVPVQGERAPGSIARAIRRLGSVGGRLGVDAILLTRGGGSVEDLWCFNDRELARAIVECPIPIVAAIGHESDTTIAELVSDQRAATPTQAAMLLTPDREALRRQLDTLDRRSGQNLRSRLAGERRRLGLIAGRPVLADPSQIVLIHGRRIEEFSRRLRAGERALRHARERELARLGLALTRHSPAAEHARRGERLRGLDARLRRALRHQMDRRAARVQGLEALAEAVGPLEVLRRGYTLTRTLAGELIRSADSVAPGDRLLTRFADGEVGSTADGGVRPRQPSRPPRPAPRTPDPGGLELFGGGG